MIDVTQISEELEQLKEINECIAGYVASGTVDEEASLLMEMEKTRVVKSIISRTVEALSVELKPYGVGDVHTTSAMLSLLKYYYSVLMATNEAGALSPVLQNAVIYDTIQDNANDGIFGTPAMMIALGRGIILRDTLAELGGCPICNLILGIPQTPVIDPEMPCTNEDEEPDTEDGTEYS